MGSPPCLPHRSRRSRCSTVATGARRWPTASALWRASLLAVLLVDRLTTSRAGTEVALTGATSDRAAGRPRSRGRRTAALPRRPLAGPPAALGHAAGEPRRFAVLGALVGAAVEGQWLALLGTGFCGGLTTYSAFAVQSVRRWTASRLGVRRDHRHRLSGALATLGSPAHHGRCPSVAPRVRLRSLRDTRLVPRARQTPAPARAPVDVPVATAGWSRSARRWRARGAEEHDADGRWLIPGLWDQHVHLDQWTLVSQRLDLTGTRSVEEVLDRVVARLGVGPEGPVLGWGHRSASWTRQPTVRELDAGHRRSPRGPDQRRRSQRLAQQRRPSAGYGCRHGTTSCRESEWFQAYPRLGRVVGTDGTSPDAYRHTLRTQPPRGSPDWSTSSSISH